MFSSLSLHGPQLEIYSKEILDRCFIVYRNASQDDRLKISIRLNLLNLIELRANSWIGSDGLNTYYKQKAATNSEVSVTTFNIHLEDNFVFFSLKTKLTCWDYPLRTTWEWLPSHRHSLLERSWKIVGSLLNRRRFLAKTTQRMKSSFVTLTVAKVSSFPINNFELDEMICGKKKYMKNPQLPFKSFMLSDGD